MFVEWEWWRFVFAFCEVEPTAFSEEDSRLVLSRVAVLLMLLVMLSALSVSAAASPS